VRLWDLGNAPGSKILCAENSANSSTFSQHSSEGFSVYQEIFNENFETEHHFDGNKVLPSIHSAGNFQAPSIMHQDAVTDIKLLSVPTKLMVTASRDGVVKVWC
jgi:hypothetical protein